MKKLLQRAVEAGFQKFEAEAFERCLRRFEQSIREEYEVAAWMDMDEHVMHDKYKNNPDNQKLSLRETPFSGYDIPLYRKTSA